MICNCDLHLHSMYSLGSSSRMDLPTLAKNAIYKGLDILGTSDALHPKWISHMKANLEETSPGIYVCPTSEVDTKFVVQTEVEGEKRVHHLILLPSLECAEALADRLKKYGNLDADGRPKLSISGCVLLDEVKDVDGILGPSHAFTPYTGIYARYQSIYECYGRQIDFLELGLSADTYLADGISELAKITFLSNSDAHSPWPNRIGREFNRIQIKKPTFKHLKKSIIQGKILLNVGFDPREGKYHHTACTRCYKHFTIDQAEKWRWECDCGGRIKKGVYDRIQELVDKKHQTSRPKYLHIIPLSEIIAKVLDVNPNAKHVQEIWERLIKKFKTEIDVLVDADLNKIEASAGKKIALGILAFRSNKIKWHVGGGGKYGEPIFPKNTDPRPEIHDNQANLIGY